MKIQTHVLFRILDKNEMDQLFNPKNKKCPFYDYIGNEEAVEALLDIAYAAFQKIGTFQGVRATNRSCRSRLRFQGPASVGKTTLARKFSQLMNLPYVETEPSQIKSANDIFEMMANACAQKGLDFEPVEEVNGIKKYEAPPMIVFIDEVHLMSSKIQDTLLKPTEANDGLMIIDDKIIDCREVCFIIGTTDGGKLRTAFRTRFQAIILHRHSLEEVAKIIKLNYADFSDIICHRIAELFPIPREALRFSHTVFLASQRNGQSLEKTVEIIRKREGICEGGISQNGVKALKALVDKSLSKKNLCSALGIEIEELDNDVLPTLIGNGRHPDYITVGHRHTITKEGSDFLKKCG